MLTTLTHIFQSQKQNSSAETLHICHIKKNFKAFRIQKSHHKNWKYPALLFSGDEGIIGRLTRSEAHHLKVVLDDGVSIPDICHRHHRHVCVKKIAWCKFLHCRREWREWQIPTLYWAVAYDHDSVVCSVLLFHGLKGTLAWAILISFISSVRSSYSHPDLLVTHHHPTPLFQITPVLNTGLSLSEPLQLYKGFNAI